MNTPMSVDADRDAARARGRAISGQLASQGHAAGIPTQQRE
jgi:hypothetical protein